MRRYPSVAALLKSTTACAVLAFAGVPGASVADEPVLAAPGAPEAREASPSPLEQAVGALQRFEGTAAEFETAAAAAVKAGLPAGDVAPMRCMYALRMNDLPLLESIVAKPDELEKRTEGKFLVQLARGQLAMEKGDFAGMEAHYKQAFWIAPDLAGVVGGFVQRGKDAQRLGTVVVPMDRKLGMSRGGETTLAELAKGKKAVLLDFWASWCGPCIASMPELKRRGSVLPAQGVVVAGINTESDAEKAEKTRAAKNLGDLPWLLDAKTDALGELLGIDTIPCAVLLSPEGKVLAKCHPEDPKLAAALEKLGVKLADLAAK